MRSYWIGLMLMILIVACSPLSLMPGSTPLQTLEPVSAQDVVNKMAGLCCEDDWWIILSEAESKAYEARRNGEELDSGVAFLEILDAAGDKFDINEYFQALSHLTLEDGYVLDYVYFAPGGGDGAPYLYAIQKNEPKFENYSEYENAGVDNYLSHILVDGTAEGFYELAVLSVMGEQFYLGWHFAYNDWEVVSSHEKVDAIIELMKERKSPLTDEQVEAVSKLDVAPRVKFEGDKVRVWILLFTKYGGFYERKFTIKRDFPHLMNEEDNQLVPYISGDVY
jgi:hypothetical protein